MKSFFNTLYQIFESMGKARAASYYSRMGNFEAAKKVMMD
jgi:hypothetical protein